MARVMRAAQLDNFKISVFLQEYLILFVIVGLILITVIVEPSFWTTANFTNIMRQFGPLSFVALGMTFVILGGFIDLSAAGVISLVAMATMSMIDVIGQGPALAFGLTLGATLGVLNASVLIVSGANTQAKALFITFGLSSIYGAAALLITGGRAMNRNFIDNPITIFEAIGQGNIGPISISFFMFLCCLVGLHLFQKKTHFGRSVNYTGGNLTAAELGGLSTKRTMILIYAVCGIMAALSAIILFSRVPVATPVVGRNFERDAIMAVVVGGTSLFGGKGSVIRTFLGVTLIVLMSNCLNLLGVQTHLQEVIRGLILVTAIWLDHRRHR